MSINKNFSFLKIIFFTMLAGCGRNNGAPDQPQAPAATNSGDVEGQQQPPTVPNPKIEGIDLAQTILSKEGHWRISPVWNASPGFSGDVVIANKLQLLFVSVTGGAVNSLSEVTVTPYMTKMNHGNGNLKPTIAIGELGAVAVTNLRFSMAGEWDIIVKATVDGHTDQAVFPAMVQSL